MIRTFKQKLCHVCKNINKNLCLKDREWECSCCHSKHDRDINAAINIKEEGLKILKNNLEDDKDIVRALTIARDEVRPTLVGIYC